MTTQYQNDDSEESSDDEDESNTGAKSKKFNKKIKEKSIVGNSGVYVPPKLSAVHYDGEDSKAERNRKQMDRAKKRALK